MKIKIFKKHGDQLEAGLIFDGDDTLWETMHLYTQAKENFFLRLADMGFNKRTVANKFEAIDVSNVQVYGFSKERFPKSIEETYHFFSRLKNRRISEKEKRLIVQIGKAVFTQKPKFIPYSRRVLLTVKKMGYQVILATKGDYSIQKKRIKNLKMASFFDKIYILNEKKEEQLKKIIEDCNLDIKTSWAIGNSIRSDINPALALGLRAIWIPYHTWSYEKDRIVRNSKLFKAASIRTVPSILRQRGRVK